MNFSARCGMLVKTTALLAQTSVHCSKTRPSCRRFQFSRGFCFKPTLQLIRGAIHAS